MFDKVLLGGHDKCVMDITALREAKHNEQVRIAAVAQASASSNTKGRGRRKAAREVVDLRTILIHCAQVYNFTGLTDIFYSLPFSGNVFKFFSFCYG